MFASSTTLSILSTFLLAGVTSVRAHGYVRSWVIDNESKPGFNPSWPPELGITAERPTINKNLGWTDHNSPSVACGGWEAPTQNIQTWDVNAGAVITAQWDEWDWGHRGPVMEYMAACPSSGCDGVDASSLQWFKISEAGWDGKEFASETISRTKAWTFHIPTEIASGPYLIRHEIIAMHDPDDPQVYPYCIQANIKSSGNVVPTDTVTFPAAYNMNDDFKHFNLYYGDDFNAFRPPGPAVWNGAGTQAPSSPAPSSSSFDDAPAAPTDVAPAPSKNAYEASSTTLVTSGAHATSRCKRRPTKRSEVIRRHAKRSFKL